MHIPTHHVGADIQTYGRSYKHINIGYIMGDFVYDFYTTSGRNIIYKVTHDITYLLHDL